MLKEMTQTCPVLFGAGAIQETGNRLKALGVNKALCICDPGIKSTGLVDKIVGIVKAAGVGVVVFDKVQPDPPDSVVDECAKLARDEKVEGIFAIGGGSSLDTAKATSVLLRNPGSIRDYLSARNGGAVNKKPGAPLVVIPTTAGTGSEVSKFTVISDTEKDFKDGIYTTATLAILDPEVTLSLPPHITASTAFDAFAHSVEGMTTILTDPKSEVLGLAAISKITKWLPVVMKDGSNLEGRSELSVASNFAGMVLNDGVVHIGHGFAHSLGALYHVEHGTGCALALPVCVEFTASAAPEMTKKIGQAMGIEFKDSAKPEEIGKKVADSIRDLMKKSGIKSVKDLKLPRDEFVAKMSADIFAKQSHVTNLCVRPPKDEGEVKQFVADIYDKYQ
ncbi:MAG: iron-containing alcohol dehydrogenase [Synergistaceae bacterium]|jgi:alcohol dehydrogenase class IV|nr:iron-containing alcohol dehydrogenase [Synergistaceae bacterium]